MTYPDTSTLENPRAKEEKLVYHLPSWLKWTVRKLGFSNCLMNRYQRGAEMKLGRDYTGDVDLSRSDSTSNNSIDFSILGPVKV